MLQLATDGAEHHLSDAIKALAKQLQLSEVDRTDLLPSDIQSRFDNKVEWARTHLGKAMVVESSRRGWFRITERGRELLADSPKRITVAYLARYLEYAVFRTKARPKEQEEIVAPEAQVLAAVGEQRAASVAPASCWLRLSI